MITVQLSNGDYDMELKDQHPIWCKHCNTMLTDSLGELMTIFILYKDMFFCLDCVNNNLDMETYL